MSDKVRKLVPHFSGTGLRRVLRTAGTGAAAVVIAVGVLFSAVASVPASQAPGKDGDLPMRLYGLIESVGTTDTAPEGVTLAQIVAVLERAERQAREQGPSFSPTIAQAAAELGMLYTTYQMQQLAVGEDNEGPGPDGAPAAPDSAEGAGGPASDAERGATEREGTGTQNDPGKNSGGKQDDDAGRPDGDTGRDSTEDEEGGDRLPPEADPPPAVEVSNERTSVIDPHDADPEAGHVTYDEVVIAAVRLANLLDPSVPNALVEVEGVERGNGNGVSLRENLLDVVDMFGGTTTGYSNGRIPADVLCPLEFAPGHMLRCDAAERLTALSAEFEAEFGYPIPITDSYRSYQAQVTLAGLKPHLAAFPGTSNHGWGIAVDLGNPIAGGNSPQYVWLRVHGPDYGWDNPSWARIGGAKPEPWHFEFFAAGSIPNRAIDPSDVGTWTPSDSGTPRYKPALDPKPKDGESSGGVRKPATRPSDQPGDNPPSQKPSKPTPKPTPDPKPSEPTDEPTRPTPPPTRPSPSPSLPGSSPSPTPTPAPSPSPTPSPSPSDDGETTCPADEADAEPSQATEQEQGSTAGTDADAGAGTDTGAEPGTDADDPDSCPSGDPQDPEPTSTLSATRPEELGLVDDSED